MTVCSLSATCVASEDLWRCGGLLGFRFTDQM